MIGLAELKANVLKCGCLIFSPGRADFTEFNQIIGFFYCFESLIIGLTDTLLIWFSDYFLDSVDEDVERI